MANVFLNLPVVANGVGASVDTTALGKERTLTIQGAFTGTLQIEVSVDGGTVFFPLLVMSQTGKRVVPVAAEFMRVRSSGVVAAAPFSPQVEVGSDDLGGNYGVIPAPAPNGVGLPLDVSAFGLFTTWILGGTWSGVIAIEISEDGTDWAECATFQAPGLLSKNVTGQFMRARSRGARPAIPFAPTAAVGAINDAGSGGGSSTAAVGGYIFQPGGGGTGPVVFEDFATLMAAMDAARVAGAPPPGGIFRLQFDDRFVSPAPIPDGTWDMENVEWGGRIPAAGVIPNLPTQVSVENAVFTNLRRFRGYLLIIHTAVDEPPTLPVADIVAGDQVDIREYVFIQSTVEGAPFFDCSSVIGNEACRFTLEEAIIGDGLVPTILGPSGAEPAGELQLIILDGTQILADAIENGDLNVTFLGNSARMDAQSGAGAIAVAVLATERWNVRSAGPGPEVIDVDLGDLVLCNPQTGLVTVQLPTTPQGAEGLVVCVKSVNDTMPFDIEIVPQVGETIDGAASYTLTVPRGSVKLATDGLTNWNII